MRGHRRLFKSFFNGLIFVTLGGQALAEVPQDELKICAAQNEPPYSMKDGTGFENRIAVALATAMDRKPVFVWSEKPAIYLVRDYLDKKACDIVIGIDSGDQRVQTSAPYYRSSYVFISRADQDLDVDSWHDQRLLKTGHIAVSFGSPGEVMLKEIGKYEDNMAYLYSLVNFRSPRNQYTQIPPARLVSEVVTGNADIAVAFAPEVGRYIKNSTTPLRMAVIKEDVLRSDGSPMAFQYDQSIGIRKDDNVLLQAVNAGLEKARPQILKILTDEGVPVIHKGT